MHPKIQPSKLTLGNQPKSGKWHVTKDLAAFKLNVERFNNLCLEQPGLSELGTRLLAIGGSVICVVGFEEDLDFILKAGQAWAPTKRQVILHKGTPSRCHDNVLSLWEANPQVKVCTGYALSEDGVWRCHSWCIADGNIVETTLTRLAYYGFILSTRQIKQRLQEL